ncbi:hypothetical protein DPMN_189167 [Dreissena polymorpha]|uniref:Uncharacterized protein n=1 Tax=Dreissena polymorpha TaxID=45954 RepID=A0A9D4DV11_DREPO|nr:hypothetical protein DPMN_189167 [Dreissena polymorpha]
MVKCEEDIQNQHAYLINTLRTNDDYHGIGLGFSNSMILMDYLQGSEHDIDVVIFERKLIAAFVTDNGLTNWPSYTGTFFAVCCVLFALVCVLLFEVKCQVVILKACCCIFHHQQSPQMS